MKTGLDNYTFNSGCYPQRKVMLVMPTVSQFRHRAEVPMLLLGGFITIALFAVLITSTLRGNNPPEWAYLASAGLLTPILMWVFIWKWSYWSKISNGVELNKDQLPEIYDEYQQIALKMGFGAGKGTLAKVPKLYLVNGNGVMNAYATKCQLDKGYIVIHSDIVDLAYLYGDFSTVRFILSHELGHIKCGHVSGWRSLINPPLTLLRLYPSLSRAQEYTADRVASYYVPEGAKGLLSLFAGKHVSSRINDEAYYRSVEEHKSRFWIRVANFFSDHAVGFRRMTALNRVESEGWDIHGKML